MEVILKYFMQMEVGCELKSALGEEEMMGKWKFYYPYTIWKIWYRPSSMLTKVLVNHMRCSVSLIGLESWGFLHEMISLLSFCCAWLTREFLQIILMRFTALRGVSGASCCQNKQGSLASRRMINMADPVLCLSFGEIFSASSILHTKCLFAHNKWDILQWH